MHETFTVNKEFLYFIVQEHTRGRTISRANKMLDLEKAMKVFFGDATF